MSTTRKKSDVEEIIEAICDMRATAEAAHNAALNLNTKLLDLRPGFASEGALIRDSANLLQHLVQDFARRSAPSIKIVERRRARV